MNRRSALLLLEIPLMVSPALAQEIGLNNAIVLTAIAREVQGINDPECFKDGRYWIRRSMEEWQSIMFPFWSVPTLRRIFSRLEKKGFILRGKFGSQEWNFDHTCWTTTNNEIETP